MLPDSPTAPEPKDRRHVSCLIVDLDNTLFDWVAMWGTAFRAMLDELVRLSGIPEARLVPEIRELHQRHHTSEYTFLVDELPSLRALAIEAGNPALFEPARAAYTETRGKVLSLYPGVLEALTAVRERGAMVVGYTESLAFVSMWRVQRLGLDGVLDFLYSPPDHEISPNISLHQLRSRPDQEYGLKRTVHRTLKEGEVKPDPAVLLDIVSNIGRSPREVVYVGDSLMRDVAMAQLAGIEDVHAAYGAAHHTEAYALLRRVSHWTDEDVQREKVILAGRQVVPTHVLSKSLGEVLTLFDFGPSEEPPVASAGSESGAIGPKDQVTWAVDAWKKSVDVQQHFNDLQL